MNSFNQRPVLSIVIPAFNAEKYISECLSSVVNQKDCANFEIIVIDDGSTDKTANIVSELYPSIRLFKKINGGVGSARNFGVSKSRGEIIFFIDADDVMLPDRLAFQGSFMLNNPNFGLAVGNIKYELNENFDQMASRNVSINDHFSNVSNAYERLLIEGNFFGTSAAAVRKMAYIKAGGQSENRMTAEDYGLWCAIAREWPVAASRRYLSWYRQSHEGNLMTSAYAYRGPVAALRSELLAYGNRLSPRQLRLAHRRLHIYVDVLLMWTWLNSNRRAVLREIEEMKSFLPLEIYAKWFFLSTLPPSIGKSICGIRSWVLHQKNIRKLFQE